MRGERLAFGDVRPQRTAPWEADVTRLEAGFAISVLRRVKLKGAWQHNWRPLGGRVRQDRLVAGQVVAWF